MQTPFPEPTSTTTFFSRERRRQRMRAFLEAFERRSWADASHIPFLYSFTKEDARETVYVSDSRSR